MTVGEALDICRAWFRHLEESKSRTDALQHAAELARQGRHDEALEIKRRIDSTPRVFDAAHLEPAVRRLVRLAKGEG